MRGQPGTFLAGLARRLTKIEITGLENLEILDQPGPAMIVVNHTTIVDVVVVVGTLHKYGFTVDGPCEKLKKNACIIVAICVQLGHLICGIFHWQNKS